MVKGQDEGHPQQGYEHEKYDYGEENALEVICWRRLYAGWRWFSAAWRWLSAAWLNRIPESRPIRMLFNNGKGVSPLSATRQSDSAMSATTFPLRKRTGPWSGRRISVDLEAVSYVKAAKSRSSMQAHRVRERSVRDGTTRRNARRPSASKGAAMSVRIQEDVCWTIGCFELQRLEVGRGKWLEKRRSWPAMAGNECESEGGEIIEDRERKKRRFVACPVMSESMQVLSCVHLAKMVQAEIIPWDVSCPHGIRCWNR
ncbi:hypothetical protein DFH09DRAFT_1070437 [Mycena vulgaris]|nr:hypothetical protein DFH09DRAFT_1070437 [Mycena vulgaris]